jgi:hypothetical protein
LTTLLSSTLGPESRNVNASGSKSTFVTRMVRLVRTLEEVVDPVLEVFIILRSVVHRTRSVGGWRRLYACQRSSDVSGRRRIEPDPSLAEMLLLSSFMDGD